MEDLDLRHIRRRLDDLCQRRELGWTSDDAELYQELCLFEQMLVDPV